MGRVSGIVHSLDSSDKSAPRTTTLALVHLDCLSRANFGGKWGVLLVQKGAVTCKSVICSPLASVCVCNASSSVCETKGCTGLRQHRGLIHDAALERSAPHGSEASNMNSARAKSGMEEDMSEVNFFIG